MKLSENPRHLCRGVRQQPPVQRRHSLGQFQGLTGDLTSGLAKKIIAEGEPVVRRIVKEERNRYAESLIGGIPFAMLSAMAFLGTKYLVPESSGTAKAVGYLTSAVSAAGGAWWTVSNLREDLPSDPVRQGSSSADPYIQKASQAIVAEAEPKVRAIVDDERRRIAEAGLAALPFGMGAAATFLATMFLVDSDKNLMKAVGYAGASILLGAGAWFGLQKELDAV